MGRQWLASALGLALAVTMGFARPAAAYRLRPAKPAAGAAATAPAAGMTTVTGMIKGAPVGKTITVVSGKKTVSVDTTGAKIRLKGRFTSSTALTPGSFVRATGALNGPVLNAKTVEIIRPAGGSKAGASKKK
jgi:hypothetical protein